MSNRIVIAIFFELYNLFASIIYSNFINLNLKTDRMGKQKKNGENERFF